MLHKTKGIFLQKIKYSETGLIVKIYTLRFGLLSFMVKGVRGKKVKQKYQALQHLALLDIEMYYKDKANLQTFKEWSFDMPYHHIPFDIKKSTIAQFLNEVIQKSIKEEEGNPELFHFIWNALLFLDHMEESAKNFHLVFLMEFSKHLGFYPQGEHLTSTPFFDFTEGRFISMLPLHQYAIEQQQALHLSLLKNTSFETLNTLQLLRSERKALLNNLITYYKLHIPGFSNLTSLPILQMIF